MVRFEFPLICVNSFVFVVRVICELEVVEAVPFSELSVKVRSPETKMRGPVLVTVLWPESVTYVNFEPLKSVTGMVVLMVDRSELVNSNAVYSALLELLDLEEEDDEERQQCDERDGHQLIDLRGDAGVPLEIGEPNRHGVLAWVSKVDEGRGVVVP